MSFQESIPAARIPRPPNAFLCFRSQLIREQKARSGQHKMQARDISRRAGHLWKEMSEEERRPYLEMSLRIKEEHMVAHPDYKFAPRKKGEPPAPRRRPQASASQKWREPEPESAFRGASPGFMPTLSSPYTPPASQGHLYLPADMSSRNEKHASLHPRSDRPESWDAKPAQFGTADAGFTAQEFLSFYPKASAPSPVGTYHTFEQQDPHVDQEHDFGALCQWNHDFSRPNAANSSHTSYYRPY